MKASKRILVLFLAMLFCVSLFPAAGIASNAAAEEKGGRTVIASGSCSRYHNWVLYSDGELYISGNSGRSFESIPWNGYFDENGSWVDSPYKTMVKSVVVDAVDYNLNLGWQDQYTTGKGAFEGMTAIKTVEVRNAQYVGIGERCFAGCTSLETLTGAIMAGDKDAFKNCSSLNGLVFWKYCGKNIQVNYDPWSGCTSLTDIYYVGSKEMWNNHGEFSMNNYPSSSVIHKAKLHTHYPYIPACSFETKYSKYAYTGNEIKPKVKVTTVCGTTLIEGKNYTVSYENNKEYGTATLVITGIGKYSGITRRQRFKILPGKVKNLRQISATDTSATAAWDKHPYAQSYILFRDFPGTFESYTVGYGHMTEANSYTETLPFTYAQDKYWLIYIRAIVTVTDPVTGEQKVWSGIANNIVLYPTNGKSAAGIEQTQ